MKKPVIGRSYRFRCYDTHDHVHPDGIRIMAPSVLTHLGRREYQDRWLLQGSLVVIISPVKKAKEGYSAVKVRAENDQELWTPTVYIKRATPQWLDQRRRQAHADKWL